MTIGLLRSNHLGQTDDRRLRRYLRRKRFVDLALALPGLVVVSPVLAVVALVVRRTSPGGALYRQTRIGRRGRPFVLVKFRSMRVGDPTLGGGVSTAGDPRITPIGRLLRATKLDELPQLVNVVRGEMSLVGPRPDLADVIDTYTDDMRRILEVPPGITGLASVVFADEEHLMAASSDPERDYLDLVAPAKVAIGMRQLRSMSVIEDLRVLLATVASPRLAAVALSDGDRARSEVSRAIARRELTRRGEPGLHPGLQATDDQPPA